MEDDIFTFDKKKYVCIGYSRINFEEEYKTYKSVTDEIIENSKFFTSEYGIYNEEWYKDILSILKRYASIYVSNHYPSLLFVFHSILKGTYIFEQQNE